MPSSGSQLILVGQLMVRYGVDIWGGSVSSVVPVKIACSRDGTDNHVCSMHDFCHVDLPRRHHFSTAKSYVLQAQLFVHFIALTRCCCESAERTTYRQVIETKANLGVVKFCFCST